MTLQVIGRNDFRSGAFPGQEDMPPNGVEDIVDGLLRDDGGDRASRWNRLQEQRGGVRAAARYVGWVPRAGAANARIGEL